MKLAHWIFILLGIVVCVWLLQQLVNQTLMKEGFTSTNKAGDVEPEERLTPEVFSYHLLQSVKGPIQRLSNQIMDMSMWRDRVETFNMTPVELARRNLQKAKANVKAKK